MEAVRKSALISYIADGLFGGKRYLQLQRTTTLAVSKHLEESVCKEYVYLEVQVEL